MKIASHIVSRRTQARHRGFTLIELLVVISIIAVLAGLLFPAMGAVRNMARKTSAKNDVTQIVNAIKMYYTEYGRYPGTKKTYDTDNNDLFEILTNTTDNTTGGADPNPRKIRFLEIPNTKIRDATTNARSGLDSAGVWRDPWGHPYVVLIDTDYTGSVGSVTCDAHSGQTPVAAETVNSEVAAYSMGNPTSKNADPITSWR